MEASAKALSASVCPDPIRDLIVFLSCISDYVKVEGCEHLSRSFKLIIIFVLSVLITLAVWGSKLLTKISGGGENFALIESHKSQKVKAKKKDEYNVEGTTVLFITVGLKPD